MKAALPAGRSAPILATPPTKRTPEQARELALHVLREQTDARTRGAAGPARGLRGRAELHCRMAATSRSRCRATVRVLKRGDIRKPGDAVEPGAVCVRAEADAASSDLPKTRTEGARRAALAKWLTSTRTTRSPGGDRQPRLAVPLRPRAGRHARTTSARWARRRRTPNCSTGWPPNSANSGSLKKLHRLIVTSADLQASRPPRDRTAAKARRRQQAPLAAEPHAARRRAGPRRDPAVSGRLDRTMGGPSDKQFDMKPGIHVTPKVDYGKFDWDRPQGHRRSVYRFVFRTLPDPLVDCLDGADASQLTPKRTESVTAPQALALLNNEFVLVHARAMAARLEKHSAGRAKQIEFGCRLVWGRAPTADEAKLFAAYADKHGLANLCRVLFNTNEFLFAD